jgi:hypothetical protein
VHWDESADVTRDWQQERFDEHGNPRCFIRPHLEDGYITLLDSSNTEVCEWHDKKFADAILAGAADIQEWGRLIKELAVQRRYMIATEFGFVFIPDSRWYRNELPDRWQRFIRPENQ